MEKEKFSIEKEVYTKHKELGLLNVYVNHHRKENNPCYINNVSSRLSKDYGCDISGDASMIAGYIEMLQDKINELKSK